MYEVYLAHHGILGQKWGVRRYQNPDGSLTAAGKKRYAIDEDGKIRKLTSDERNAIDKKEKQRSDALAKARAARAEKARRQAEEEKKTAERQAAIKTGDADRIKKYFDQMSDSEIKEALSRIDAKKSLQQALNDQTDVISNGKTKTDLVIQKIGKATDYANALIGFYNVAAKVNNAFNPDKRMNQIDGSWIGDANKQMNELKRDLKKEQVLNSGSAKEILAYAKRHKNVTGSELGQAIKTLQNRRGLEIIAKGGDEAERVLKTFKPDTSGDNGGKQNGGQQQQNKGNQQQQNKGNQQQNKGQQQQQQQQKNNNQQQNQQGQGKNKGKKKPQNK